jgi:hypothetical protein
MTNTRTMNRRDFHKAGLEAALSASFMSLLFGCRSTRRSAEPIDAPWLPELQALGVSV